MTTRDKIFATLSYFNAFDYPLTEMEVFWLLWKKSGETFELVSEELIKMIEEKKLAMINGFYFFSENEKCVERRGAGVVPTEMKLRKAKLAARLISFVPFLKSIFVCNSVAAGTANEESDIDFFIICTPHKLWTVRFFSNIILLAFKMRTGAKVSANRICLSFFVAENSLDLSGVRIADDDVYLAYWSADLIPLYDTNNIYENYFKANSWLGNFLVDFPKFEKPKNGKQKIKIFIEKFLGGKAGNYLENLVKNIQYKKLKPNLAALAKQGGVGVVINDKMLKFHENDAREEIRYKWIENIQKYAR